MSPIPDLPRTPAAVAIYAKGLGLKAWPEFVERACCTKKEVIYNGGWRGSKSTSAAFSVFLDIILYWLHVDVERDPDGKPLTTHLIWLVGPDYQQARTEFQYLMNWLARMKFSTLGDISTPAQGPLHGVWFKPGFPGVIEIATKQAGDPSSLGSVAPVIVLGCEVAQWSEEARYWIDGRCVEKNARFLMSGTFGNETGKQTFAWFEELSKFAWDNPNPRLQAFRLPTWENLARFGNCLEGESSIILDPTLKDWCPDDNHGELHSGQFHPMIKKLEEQWRDRPREWRKFFGGEPMGIGGEVYEWAQDDDVKDLTNNIRLISMSEYQKKHNIEFKWTRTKGGLDPGLVHPAGICVGSKNQFGQLWVRRAIKDDSHSADVMWAWKSNLQKEYPQLDKWGGDPVGLRYLKDDDNIHAMVGSLTAREERVGIVNGATMPRPDHPDGILFFDADDEGVRHMLWPELKLVHRRKRSDGQMEYWRVGEDTVSAFENMVAEMQSTTDTYIPGKVAIPKRPNSQKRYGRRDPVSAA